MLLGTAVSQLASIVTAVVCARILKPEGFGEFGIINSTISMLGVFAGLGLGTCVTKFAAEFRDREPLRAGRIVGLSLSSALALSLVVALAVFFFAPFLATSQLANPGLLIGLRIGCVLLVLNTMMTVQQSVLAGFENFRGFAILSAVRGVLGLMTIPLLTAKWAAEGAVSGLVVAGALSVIVGHYAVLRCLSSHKVALQIGGSLSELGTLWRFFVPAFLSGAISAPFAWLVSAAVVRGPNGYFEMGLWNAASQWRNLLVFLPSVLRQASMPIVANLLGDRKGDEARQVVLQNLYLNVVLVAATALPVGLGSRWIMRAYGQQFEQGWPALAVVACSIPFYACGEVITSAWLSAGKVWLDLTSKAVWAVALAGAVLLSGSVSSLGASTAFLGAYAATLAFVVIVELRGRSRGALHGTTRH